MTDYERLSLIQSLLAGPSSSLMCIKRRHSLLFTIAARRFAAFDHPVDEAIVARMALPIRAGRSWTKRLVNFAGDATVMPDSRGLRSPRRFSQSLSGFARFLQISNDVSNGDEMLIIGLWDFHTKLFMNSR